MLHVSASLVELRQAIRRQPKCLCHKPGELVAQTLDRREVPQISRFESRHVLLVRPLKTINQLNKKYCILKKTKIDKR